MDNLIEKIKEYIMEECRKYKEASEDHYDFWNEHIRYVYAENTGWTNFLLYEKSLIS